MTWHAEPGYRSLPYCGPSFAQAGLGWDPPWVLDAALSQIISPNPTTNGALFRQPRSSTAPAFYDASIVIINLYHGQRPYR